ncbi:MAG: glycosyltransferase family 1 protein, partial [Gemmatimonadetes bacterium]|nr:glycosyltransferase family 1 protein [Gemmatimonadota bacterium]
MYQRPQHLLSRFARERRVFFVEEPVWGEGSTRMEVSPRPDGVRVAIPHLPEGTGAEEAEALQQVLLDEMLREQSVEDFILWYYTPMALGFSRHLQPLAVVYDVMDELSMFRFAPPTLLQRESELYERADVVFTGGQSLFEAKRERHPNVHLFPSSIDAAHFGRARTIAEDPEDQASIGRPRLGYFGVIDERLDLDLLAGLADAR